MERHRRAAARPSLEGLEYRHLLSGVDAGPAVRLTRSDPPRFLDEGTIAFSSAAASAAESGGRATITVVRSDASGAASVLYATSDGTGRAGVNYQAASGTLEFADGEASKSFDVTILRDFVLRGPLTVNLALATPSGADLGDPSAAVLTIADSDLTIPPPPVLLALGASSYSVAEGAGSVAIQVVRSGNNPLAFAGFGYEVVAGSASADDFTAVSGRIDFAPGEATATILVPVADDALVEGAETFVVRLTRGFGDPYIGPFLQDPSEATVTILSDDAPPPPPPPTRFASGSTRRVGGVVRAVSLTFDAALDAASASSRGTFSVVAAGRDGKLGTRDDRAVRVRRAAAPGGGSVALVLAKKAPARQRMLVRFVGLRDALGRAVDAGSITIGPRGRVTAASAAPARS